MPGAGTLSFAPATSPFPCSSPSAGTAPDRRTAPLRIRCPPSAATATASCRAATRNPYEVLCVEASASAAEIKAAYRALAKRLHPDAAGGASEDEFIEVHDAYATLSDPDARALYDRGAFPIRYAAPAGFRPRGRRWETDQCW